MAKPKGVKRKVVEGIADFAVRALPDDLEASVRQSMGLPSMAVPRRAAPPKPLALPAPPKQLALPAPGPGLPKFAAKPRGGQFWVDKDFDGSNTSPEAAARKQAENVGGRFLSDEDLLAQLSGDAPLALPPETMAVQDWLARTLAKYYKTDFGSPDDPLRGLAERGLHYDPEMTPEKWQATVNSYLMEDPVESILFPPNPKGGMRGAGSNLRGEAMVAMPWLAKLPVTDKVYGITGGGLDLEHFADEFANALKPERSGLPMDLAVRPESLNRMTFPQAVERVGRINQFRAKEMERAALSNLGGPAVQTFKEYPENNPMGLRWTELRAPEMNDSLLSDFDRELIDLAAKEGREIPSEHMDMVRKERAKTALQDALKYEGDTMGHCVGGYCDYVMAGHSRIFSLRDAKGEPHVTIETAPTRRSLSRDEANAINRQVSEEIRANPELKGLNEDEQELFFRDRQDELVRALLAKNPSADDIVQIKGKQNRAPKDDYLPFVQDFVKSGQWGNVGDLGNTGLVKLPDGRYITQQQFDAATTADALSTAFPPSILKDEYYARILRDPSNWDAEDWEKLAPNFEGYAIGGRVSADRCFSRNPMSVKKARGGGMAVKYGC
jgi:PcfJ-like protein